MINCFTAPSPSTKLCSYKFQNNPLNFHVAFARWKSVRCLCGSKFVSVAFVYLVKMFMSIELIFLYSLSKILNKQPPRNVFTIMVIFLSVRLSQFETPDSKLESQPLNAITAIKLSYYDHPIFDITTNTPQSQLNIHWQLQI